SDQARNPLVDLSIYVLPADIWSASAEGGDNRVGFHVTATDLAGRTQPLDQYARFTGNSSPLPAYWPDEMRLIRAEALLQSDLPGAIAAVNEVRTRCTSPLQEPVACLSPTGAATEEAVREEIYAQRRFALYATGQSWEDARRLGQVGQFTAPLAMSTSRAQRCWLPYPQGERNANSNVPPDPEPETAPPFPEQCF